MFVAAMKRKILSDVLSQRPDGLLYHYTTQAGLLGIIRDREIWMTHTQYLNDSREFLHALQVVREELVDYVRNNRERRDRTNIETLGFPVPPELGSHEAEVERTLQEMLECVGEGAGIESINVCLASFSEDGDSLSQWRAYASRGGFCIGFAGAGLAELVVPHKFYLARCLYDRDQQRELARALIEEVLEENLERNKQPDPDNDLPKGGNLLAYLNRYAPILKDPAFAEEREWRIISRPLMCTLSGFGYREGPSMLIPFFKFPLIGIGRGAVPVQKVVIGPTPHPDLSASSVTSFLVSKGLRDVGVSPSAVPYRNW
jgi:hypothetical protein